MPSPTIYSFTVLDDKGVKATSTYFVAYDAATETAGALAGNIAALGGLLDAITGGQITDCRIIIDVAPDPSWKSAPIADTNVEVGGLFTFKQANSKYVDSQIVPALKASLITGGKINLTTGGPVDLWIKALTQGTGIGGSNTVFANSKFLNVLNAFLHCDLSVRKHRRSLTKQTTEA